MQELLFLLLPLAFLSGWQTAKKRYKKAQSQKRQLSDNLVKGINFLLSEQPDKALEVFLSHPEIDEYTAETYLLLGNMFRGRGEVDRALRVHQNLIGRSGLAKEQKVAAMLAYGEDFFAAGMLDRAEGVFQELIKNNEGDVQACGTLRSIYEQLQDWDKAIEVSLCAEKHTGDDHSRFIAHYYCELAKQEFEAGNIHLVEDYIQQALKSHKQSNRVLVLQGDLENRKNKPTLALKKYQKAISNDPRLIGLLDSRLIETTKKIGDIELLCDYLRKLLAKTKDEKILEYLVELSLRFGIEGGIAELANDVRESSSVKALQGVVRLWKQESSDDGLLTDRYGLLDQVLEQHIQKQTEFQCHHCGYKMNDFMWRCPACHYWDTVS